MINNGNRFIIKHYYGSDGKDFQRDFVEYLKDLLKSQTFESMSEYQLFLQGGEQAIKEIIKELDVNNEEER